MSKTLKRISTLLDQEAKAIKSADVARLERLHQRKEPLISHLESQRHDRSQVKEMQEKADRNAQLLKAMIDGVKDARSLLARINDQSSDVTYSRGGVRTSMTPPKRRLQHKA